jgi:anaerobic selenocysteine-containing dehydrogenase
MNTQQPETCKLSRRDFLKIAGAGGATAAFLGSLPQIQATLCQKRGRLRL